MYADMVRRMQMGTVEIKKKAEKAAIIAEAEAEVRFPLLTADMIYTW
jgi:hypothetical protein